VPIHDTNAKLVNKKVQGHILIDLLIAQGKKKKWVYLQLERKNRMEPHLAHFGNCTEVHQVEKNIKILKSLLQSVEQKKWNKKNGIEKKWRGPKKHHTLPLKKQKDILKTFNNNHIQKKTLWQRLKRKLRNLNASMGIGSTDL